MIKRLGDIASFRRGLTYSKGDEAPLSNKRVLRSNNIDLESSSLDLSEIKYLREDFIIPEDRKLVANSIFICMSNGSKQHVGKVAFIPEDMDYAFGGFMGLIVPSSEVSAKYVFYACQSSAYRTFLSKIGNGIGITNLKFSDLERFEFPVPSLADQQRIVAELDLLSGIVEKKNAQLKTLDNLAQSIFHEMFGDPIVNERGWDYKRLDEVAEIVGGATPKTQIEEYWEGDNYWVTPAELHKEHYKGATERTISNEAVRKTNVTLLPVGTVLLSSRAPIGKVAITTVPMYCNQGFKNLICSGELNNEYAFQVLFSNTEYLNSLGTGATFKEISKKTTEAIKIAVPPIELQDRFAERAKKIESEKEQIKASLASAEQLFASRMEKYFNV